MSDEPTDTATDQATEPAGAADAKPKLKQSVETRDVGPCKKHIKVTVERDEIDQRFSEKYSKLVVDANVSGFRPGKAPRRIIERRFKKDVGDQVKAEVMLASLEQLAEEHDVAPLSPPDIDPSKIEIPEHGPFVYEFEVEVRPQFELPSYKGLKLRRPVVTFTEEDVTREERRLLEPYGQLIPKPGKTPEAEVGDTLTVDLTARDGDRVLREIRELRIRVEPRVIFQDGVAEHFAEQVKWAKPGESRVVDVTLSDRVAEPALRGRKLQVSLAINDIKTLRLPELTHEQLHEFGVHSYDQLRELLRANLHRRLEYEQRQDARRQVLEHIAAAASWELPQDLLVRQARQAFNRRLMEMRSAGMSEEDIKSNLRLLQQDSLQTTALALKEHFVMQKIAEVEKLECDDDDIDSEIERIARQYDEAPRRIRARLEKEEQMDALAAELTDRKALDLVLQEAEYEDVPATKTGGVATVEEQLVPGEMQDPTAAPPPGEAQAAPSSEAAGPAKQE